MAIEAGAMAVFGGGGGPAPGSGFVSAPLANPPSALASPFTSGGNALTLPRVEMATVASAGALYVLGGFTGGPPESAPTSSTELSTW